jgi:hypothetical protein
MSVTPPHSVEMNKTARRLEAVTLFALLLLLFFTFYFWDMVQKAHRITYNTLGNANVHVPTADLFLWAAVAVLLYFGARIWSALAPHVFQLSTEKATIWHRRLLAFRIVSTFLFLGLTVRTVHSFVPDFIDKLPWP